MATTPVVVVKGRNGQLGSAMSTTPIVVEVKGRNGQLVSAMSTTPRSSRRS